MPLHHSGIPGDAFVAPCCPLMVGDDNHENVMLLDIAVISRMVLVRTMSIRVVLSGFS
jgi:hypothetical protein